MCREQRFLDRIKPALKMPYFDFTVTARMLMHDARNEELGDPVRS
jgi:hypothetical protein